MSRPVDHPKIDFTPSGAIGYIPSQTSRFGSLNSNQRSQQLNDSQDSSAGLVDRAGFTPQTLQFTQQRKKVGEQEETKKRLGILSAKNVTTNEFRLWQDQNLENDNPVNDPSRPNKSVTGKSLAGLFSPGNNNSNLRQTRGREHRKNGASLNNPFFNNIHQREGQNSIRSPLSKIKESYLRDPSRPSVRHKRVDSSLSYLKSESWREEEKNSLQIQPSPQIDSQKKILPANYLNYHHKDPEEALDPQHRNSDHKKFLNSYQDLKKSKTPNSLSSKRLYSLLDTKHNQRSTGLLANRFRTPNSTSYRELSKNHGYSGSGALSVRANHSGSRG